jgi:exo-1,4-beta-D-glucosaminidase
MQMNTNHKYRIKRIFVAATLVVTLMILFTLKAESTEQTLKKGWFIRSSDEVSAKGEAISKGGFDMRGWYTSNVPSTVLSALQKNGVYHDLYYGKNLETVSPDSFRTAWWYVTKFDAPFAETARLIFDGINYSADIFLNGTKIGESDKVAGAFRRFDFDISRVMLRKNNVLAVKVYPPKPGDFTIGFVDWNPAPPDRNMGLWREVTLRTSGPVSIEDPFIQTKLDLESFSEAKLTVSGTIVNHTDRAVSGKINGQIEGMNFSQQYSLAPKESKEIRFPDQIVKSPRVWWPNNFGNPDLYTLKMSVSDLRGISDSRVVIFGIREVADYINKEGHRGYMVNGKKILIRGGGWVDDLLLDEDEKKLEAQLQYTKHLNLNLIRLEGFWGSSQKLYELADRYGLLVMAGFSCQWEWTHYLGKYADEPYGGARTPEDFDLLSQYLRDQVIWLRNHPSILVWALASDMLPHPELEKRYREGLAKIDPTRPALVSTKTWTSEVSGPSAVKMNGPYEYEPPNYWYVDKKNGGAFGFDTEVSPGAQPPPLESLQRMFSKEHWWPPDETWNFHAGRSEFKNMDRYMIAFNKRYGEAEDIYDFAARSQAMNYEAIRAMYEAFGIRKPVSTGIVQWMLNAAWPKMFWQLYDYYLMPGGAFYGARKANQPLNIAYDYETHSVHIINDTYNAFSNLDAEINVFSEDSKSIVSKIVKTSIGENESKKILDLQEIPKVPVYFLSLKLKDSQDKVIADNFYWLPEKQDVYDFKGSDWYYTPIKEYADFTPLNKLPPVKIGVEENWTDNGVSVTLKNPEAKIAFFIELKILRNKTGESVLPVFWDDNYVSLLPGETKVLNAKFSPDDLRGEKPLLQYSGWNVSGGSDGTK